MALRYCVLAFAASILMAACAPPGKTAFEQAGAVDARPFLTEAELMRGVSEETWSALSLDYDASPARVLVVPHHAAASALSAKAISGLADEPPPAVIILAPNHYNEGSAVTVPSRDFICYGGKLRTDASAVARLRDAGLVSVNDAPFAREHSVGMLLPIISWYLPDTKVIPVIFHHGHDAEGIVTIIEALRPETDRGAVVIASIDFSHYLTMEEAEEKDRETRGRMESGDAGGIAGMKSDHIDSPTIMAALMMHYGVDSMEITANTNSGVIMGNPVSPCTSYFTIKFY